MGTKLPWSCEKQLIIYLELQEVREKGGFQEKSHKLQRTYKILEALPLSRLFFPLVKH